MQIYMIFWRKMISDYGGIMVFRYCFFIALHNGARNF